MTDTTTADMPGAPLLALRLEYWAEHDEGLRGDDMRTAAITLRRLHALAAQEAKPEALQIAPVNNEAGSTMSIVRWQIETPAGWVGAYHKAPLEYLLAARLTASAMPSTAALPAAEWSEMEYWLDRCEDKGHLENCADLLEPWANLKAAMVAARAKEGKA